MKKKDHQQQNTIRPSKIRIPSPNEVTQGNEPTTDQLKHEKGLQEETPPSSGWAKPESNKKGSIPKDTRDIIVSYMEQLRHIPLLSAEDEIEGAKKLEKLANNMWDKLLEHPGTTYQLAEIKETLEPTIQQDINALLTSYRRATKKTKKRPLPANARRDKIRISLANKLRQFDSDKELYQSVLRLIRAQVQKSPEQQAETTEYPINREDLLQLERARGLCLRARNNYVRANLRLVVSVAKRFHNKRVPLIDLLQEGNTGLMKAVHRFDYRRGYRFSTYAHWWIRQSIERAIINKGPQVRLPVHIIDARKQVKRVTNELQQTLGREPQLEEIAQGAMMSSDKLIELMNSVQTDSVSLNEAINTNDARTYIDLVRDENAPAIDEAVIRENTAETVVDLMGRLSPIEREIITSRFGLESGEDETLDDIGRRYKLSRERVRQIQVQGLAKMRRMCERRHISF